MRKTYDIDTIKYLNAKKHHYFFSPNTMRFFKSRVESGTYRGNYFLTSEKSPYGSRKYTIRKFDGRSGDVRTVGDFQAFGTRKAALKALKIKAKVKIRERRGR